MPWKEANVMDLRTEFIQRALRADIPFAALCRRYGISTKTGYKWKQRFLADGLPGLADRSRRPNSKLTMVTEDVCCEIVRFKGLHEDWGPKKIHDLYSKADHQLPAVSLSTVKRVLDKAGLTERRRRRRRSEDCGRIANPLVATAPNEVWTVDFKGWWYSTTQERVVPLTVRDAYSRYVLLAQAVADGRMETVQECFARLFTKYGLPLVIRSDNGSPFACTSAPLGLSRLSAWWVTLGISLDRIEKGHPEQNGGHERMHRDIALEVEGRVDGNLVAQQAALDIWREQYNHERPHEALGMRRPAELYIKSERRFDPQPVELEYPAEYLRRRVTRVGCIKIGGRLIRISAAVGGWHVGLQPVSTGIFNVWFGPLHLGELNVQDKKITVAG
jgi:putative transposase